MSQKELLSCLEVREYLSDYATNNYLLGKEEFSDTLITLSKELAVDSYNEVPPVSRVNLANFPSKNILLNGTLWHLFDGKSTLLARNTMSYSDGGLQIPIEERFQLYSSLAETFRGKFMESTRALKTHLNMESGWGSVRSDQSNFPVW